MKKLELIIIYLLLFLGGIFALIYSIFDKEGLDDICTQIDERQEI